MTERARKYLSDILLAIELIDEFVREIDNFLTIRLILKPKVLLSASLE